MSALLHSPTDRQDQFEVVLLENLVPQDHLLRKVQKYIDFSFIREKVRGLYSEDNGRPSIDPVVLFKMLFLGYLYGIRSERRLVEEIQVNLAYRWFLGLHIEDPVPHHSTISQNRRRRFLDNNIAQEIFDEIVRQAMRRGLVEGRVLFSDSTHIKANANKKKFIERQVSVRTKQYLDELEAAVEEDRAVHGKKALARRKESEPSKVIKESTTDPESGYMYREGKPEGFFYLDHRTVDGKLNLITDVHVTPGSVHDSVPYLDRLDRQQKTFGFDVKQVALDSGYLTNAICHELQERDIFAVIAHRRFHSDKEVFAKRKFQYDAAEDTYRCPAGEKLTYRTTNRDGYREYKSDPEICRQCPLLSQCTKSRTARKTLARHVWEDSRDWVHQNRLSEEGKALYARRKETIERSFADAKELHGHRYARFRGIRKVREQCLLEAAAQNMKKMAQYLDRMEKMNEVA